MCSKSALQSGSTLGLLPYRRPTCEERGFWSPRFWWRRIDLCRGRASKLLRKHASDLCWPWSRPRQLYRFTKFVGFRTAVWLCEHSHQFVHFLETIKRNKTKGRLVVLFSGPRTWDLDWTWAWMRALKWFRRPIWDCAFNWIARIALQMMKWFAWVCSGRCEAQAAIIWQWFPRQLMIPNFSPHTSNFCSDSSGNLIEHAGSCWHRPFRIRGLYGDSLRMLILMFACSLMFKHVQDSISLMCVFSQLMARGVSIALVLLMCFWSDVGTKPLTWAA